jgi:putative DNA primase/helicase
MAKSGQRLEAGQAIRLAEIPADAEHGLGIYEDLHGRTGGAALSEELVDAAAKHYGVVGVRFLELVAARYEESATEILELSSEFVPTLLTKGAEGQDSRAAARFGLVAAAGTLATRLGLTGWPEQQALEAARQCFQAWTEARGGAGNQERRAALRQVRRFLELHGKSRFSRKDGRDSDRPVSNRAGFYDEEDDGTWFYVLPQAYRSEVCQGRVAQAVSKVLIAERWLIPDTEGKSAQSTVLPGLGQSRCYVLAPRALQAGIE